MKWNEWNERNEKVIIDKESNEQTDSIGWNNWIGKTEWSGWNEMNE